MNARCYRATAALLGLLLMSAGCTPARAPQLTPTPPPTPVQPTSTTPARPGATKAASPVPSPTPLPAPVSATAAPDALPPGWTRAATDQLSVALPPGWRPVELQGKDAQAAFDALQKSDARLADIIGGPEALKSAAFWAFGPEPAAAEAQFVDNLNIRRTPLGPQRVPDMQQVLDVLLPEYEKMGLQVTSSDATLRVNGQNAARVTYTLMMNGPGEKTFEVRGRQFVVATDTDLWVLSFSTTPEREGEMAAEFERLASSFEPRR